MNWIIFAQIVAQYGIPVAEAILKKVQTGGQPTEAEVEELKALAQQTALDRMKAQLVAAGIPLDSDRAKELLALTLAVNPTPMMGFGESFVVPDPTLTPEQPFVPPPSPEIPPVSAPPEPGAPTEPPKPEGEAAPV